MTIDYSRRGKAAKRKGANAELEVRDLLREHGWLSAHRQFMSGGAGGGDLADAIPDWHIEVKRTERLDLNGAWRQADAAKRPTDSILICHRANSQPWLATLLLTDLMVLSNGSWWSPIAISKRQSVRAEFMARLKVHARPLLVHTVCEECVATLMFEHLLSLIELDAA